MKKEREGSINWDIAEAEGKVKTLGLVVSLDGYEPLTEDSRIIVKSKKSGVELELEPTQLLGFYGVLEDILESYPQYRINRLWERVKTKWDK